MSARCDTEALCNLHAHECRRCGQTIWCEDGDGWGRCTWEGDNIGCPDEAAEMAAEAL